MNAMATRTVRVDMTRYSGSDNFVTRVDRAIGGRLTVGEQVSVVDDAVEPQTFKVAAVLKDGRTVRLVRV